MAALDGCQCISALPNINGHLVPISIYHNAVSMQTGYLYSVVILVNMRNLFYERQSMFRFLFASISLIFYTQSVAATGENTYKQVCAVCHQNGVAGAPKLGDKAKWAPLIKEGQAQLTAHGYVGVRGMPAKGGKADLSVADFAASLVFMVNQSGGSWQNPDAKMLERINAEIIKLENTKKK